MSRQRTIRVSVGLFASSILLNVLLVSCAADSVTGSAQGSTPEIVEKLDSVLARLSALEAQLARQGDSIAGRLDTLVARGGAGGGAGSVGGIDSARVDSILGLASYLAREASIVNWEICGGVEIGLSGSAVTKGEGKASAAGDVGAWAGTGAFAGVDLEVKREYELEGEVEMPFSIAGCLPLGAGNPPVRPDGAAQVRTADANLQSTLTGLASQFGLDETRVAESLNSLATGMQSPASLRIQDAASLLPLPSGLSSVFSDPLGALRSEIPTKADEAVSLLCGGGWGSRLSTPVQVACDRIAANNVDIGGLFEIVDSYPQLQASVNATASRLGTVCSRLNIVGNQSLTIPNPLNIGPNPFYGPSRLFPSYSTLSC